MQDSKRTPLYPLAIAMFCLSCGSQADESGGEAKAELQEGREIADEPGAPTGTVSSADVGTSASPPGERYGEVSADELCLPASDEGLLGELTPDPGCENASCGDTCDPCFGESPCEASPALQFMCSRDRLCVAVVGLEEK